MKRKLSLRPYDDRVGGPAGDDGMDGAAALAATGISSPDVATDNTAPITTELAVDPFLGRLVAERYRVLALLGRGGMGSVYVAEHVQLSKRVALKVLSDELRKQPMLVARFLTEARAAAQIGHPNIVDVFDVGELPEGGAFIAMALLEGRDVQEELDDVTYMTAGRARHIVSEICRALAAAHSKGIVHRDMKPATVFLARDSDGNEQVKVLDFGIAQIQEATGEEARLTQTGALVGTPAFMSPEQGRGDRTDHRTDIYSVGCILYNLVTGEQPFIAGTLMGVLTKHLLEPPMPPSERQPAAHIGADLDAVVLRAMAKDPAQRYQTMKERWQALTTVVSDRDAAWPEDVSGRYARVDPAIPVREPRPSGMRAATSEVVGPPPRLGVWLGLALTGLALCGAAFVLLRRPVAPPPVATADVSIEIDSTPPGATVRDGEEALGATPLHLLRRRSGDSLSVRLAADGYEQESVHIALDHDRTVDVHLRPSAVTPSPPVSSSVAMPRPHAQPRPSSVKKTGRDGNLKDPFGT